MSAPTPEPKLPDARALELVMKLFRLKIINRLTKETNDQAALLITQYAEERVKEAKMEWVQVSFGYACAKCGEPCGTWVPEPATVLAVIKLEEQVKQLEAERDAWRAKAECNKQ